MSPSDQLKAFSNMAETTRKWISVLDAKAAFLSTLSAASLSFLWTGAKLQESSPGLKCAALVATLFFVAALGLALWTILPRISLKQALGRPLVYKNGYEPISFYGYVASKYPASKNEDFIAKVCAMDESALAREALEQHFTISHVAQRKTRQVILAGYAWIFGAICFVGALIWRVF